MRKDDLPRGGLAPALPRGLPAPADLESLETRIRLRRPDLPPRLAQVAEFALSHPQDMAFGTAASLAGAAGVQPSTLVRFAQSLGYDGFSALQEVFRSPLRRQLDPGDAPPPPADGAGPVFAAAAAGILEAAAAVPPDRFAAAAALLGRAETIHLLARRRSFPVTSYMAYAFGLLRIRCQLAGSAIGMEEEMLALAQPGDAAVAVSFAPYAPETLRQAGLLRARGVPVVALTDGADSPLIPAATLAFPLLEARADDAHSLPAGMAFAIALTRAVAEVRLTPAGPRPRR